jgi:hypothetical protein
MSERRPTPRQRRAVVARARECCEYCRSPAAFALESFAVDHIVPVQKGGSTVLGNLALACFGCNQRKHTKTDALDPVTGAAVPLFHPRRQRWVDHFAWNDDASLIIGLTPVGRATVDALKLNRPQVVNLRRLLYLAGLHPPTEDS